MLNNPIVQWIGIIVGGLFIIASLIDLYFGEHDPDDHDVV